MLASISSLASLSLSKITDMVPAIVTTLSNASSSSSSDSSSSFIYEWTYDVFISFRGTDTCWGFTGNLYKALRDKGIKTFLDDGELHKGTEIASTLVKAIRQSRIAIVVFSKDYASSPFCLDEVENIMEWSKEKGTLFVLPVFYQVDPCDVRHQRGSYAAALAKHEARFEHKKVQKWRLALKQAADLSGEHLTFNTHRYEYEFIENIIQEVSKKISHTPLHITCYPVGLKSRLQEVNSCLNIESHERVRIVGIYGIEGIGKTTLALYNSIFNQFENVCFLDEICGNSKMQGGLVQLQEKLLNELVGEKNIKLGSINKGIPLIKRRLCGKKVLLILDDVDELKQLEALAGERNWFGHGSIVIITTRNNNDLLRSFGVASSYKVEPLNNYEACELINFHAFKSKEPLNPNYLNIVERVMCFCRGVPRHLEDISSKLFGKAVWECNSILNSLQIPCIYGKHVIISKKGEDILYPITVKVALDADLYDQIGRNIIHGHVDHDKVRSFSIDKRTPFIHLKEGVAKEYGIPVMYQRFWFWSRFRQLTPQEETLSVGDFIGYCHYDKANNVVLKLFLELEIGQDLRLSPLPTKSNAQLLIFFKLYDPSHEKIRYVGRFYVKDNGKPMHILARLNEMAGFDVDEEIILFKEDNINGTCEQVYKNYTFLENKCYDGALICFQKALKDGSHAQYQHPYFPSFWESIRRGPVEQKKWRERIYYKAINLKDNIISSMF